MSLLASAFESSPMSGWTAQHANDLASAISGGHSGNCAWLSNDGYSYGGYWSPTFTATTDIVLDVWFKADFFMYLSGGPILKLQSGSTPLISIYCQTGSSAQFEVYQYSGSTPSLVATTTNYFAENTWHHLVLAANLITAGTATLTVNGTEEISAAMGNFGNGASGATRVAFATAPFTNIYYDELDISAAGGGGGGGPGVSVRRQRFPRGLCRGLCQR